MTHLSNEDLILSAKSVIRPRSTASGKLIADVGAALVTEKGNVYKGVCIDTQEGTGFCAEQSAISAMVTAGESRIKKIVAVWKDGAIIPPCGKCREIIWQINKDNWDAEVIVEKRRVVMLKELLPHHWHNKF